MAKIKRKTSKRKTKTRRNCIPCNPSMRGMRRVNPDNLLDDIDTHLEKLSKGQAKWGRPDWASTEIIRDALQELFKEENPTKDQILMRLYEMKGIIKILIRDIEENQIGNINYFE